jgi:hypothetical protein
MAFHLLVLEPSGLVNAVVVQNALNAHTLDWYRFAPASWVVVSDDTAEGLYGIFHPFMPPNGNVLVCRLDVSDRQGWMQQKFWEWLAKYGF